MIREHFFKYMLLMILFANPSFSWGLPIETDTALILRFESNALRSFVRVIRQGKMSGIQPSA
ncbi:hypothetical protein MNBD_NITROSPIRAE01-444 [hydrothermal vent metagenome]|uniref:Uncharacterized protein n=1 Tax=hydrothermal vent metagenome TaxID=652676 RepID=A0A3B1DRF7_9ZZZZ